MVQYLKYSLLLLVILLAQLLVMASDQSASEISQLACNSERCNFRSETCYLSQDESTFDLLEQLYHFHTNCPCEVSQTGEVPSPTDKCLLLLKALFCHHSNSSSPQYTIPSQSILQIFDPITHYIYGLRKIVI